MIVNVKHYTGNSNPEPISLDDESTIRDLVITLGKMEEYDHLQYNTRIYYITAKEANKQRMETLKDLSKKIKELPNLDKAYFHIMVTPNMYKKSARYVDPDEYLKKFSDSK